MKALGRGGAMAMALMGGCGGAAGGSSGSEGVEESSSGSSSGSSGSSSGSSSSSSGGGKSEGPGCDEEPACGEGEDVASCPEQCSVCGDSLVTGVEECDDGNAESNDSCIACIQARCGDAAVEEGVEECDDGNAESNDSCIACLQARCGDGHIQAGTELCDDGPENSDEYGPYGHCNATCNAIAAYCGDGELNGPEACDAPAHDGCLDCAPLLSCKPLVGRGLPSAVYRLFVPGGPESGVAVYCDLDADGGGYSFLKLDVSPMLHGAAQAEMRCGEFGMKLWVPRSAAHLQASWAVATADELLPEGGGAPGGPDYMALAGVYAKAKGISCLDDAFEGLPLNSLDCPSWGTNDNTAYWVSDKPGKVIAVPLTYEPSPVNCTDCSMQFGWKAPGVIEYYDATNAPGASSPRFMCDIGDKVP